MFTGIVESTAQVQEIIKEGTNLRFRLLSDLALDFKVDQSISHNGVCLTVEKVDSKIYEVVAVKETLLKTSLGELKKGNWVNLERCMKMNGRLDGHIVQGHVDTVALVTEINSEDGSHTFRFQLQETSSLIVEKGSICINGVSLTAFEVTNTSFSVAIIPYTFKHTGFNQLSLNEKVNIEFDIIGKYVAKLLPKN